MSGHCTVHTGIQPPLAQSTGEGRASAPLLGSLRSGRSVPPSCLKLLSLSPCVLPLGKKFHTSIFMTIKSSFQEQIKYIRICISPVSVGEPCLFC